MEPNNLIIGDYISVDNEICKVTAIYSNGTVDYEGNGVSGTTDNPQPILLTTEILEKNGFQLTEGFQDAWSNFSITVFKLLDRFRVLYTHLDVKYVHELQHLYKLLRSCDKEIKL